MKRDASNDLKTHVYIYFYYWSLPLINNFKLQIGWMHHWLKMCV